MSRIPKAVIDPKQPQGIVDYLYRVASIVDGHVEFGHPQDPSDPQSATVANGTTHNGTLMNLEGSWFTVLQTQLARSNHVCRHNLYPDTFPVTAGLIPVRWIQMGWMHDGTGGGAGTQIAPAVAWVGGPITYNSIELAVAVNVLVGPNPTVDVTHPLRLDLFFVKAVR